MSKYSEKYNESLKVIETKFVGRISLLEQLSITAIKEAVEKAEKYDELVGYIGEDFLDGTWDNGAFTDKNGRRIIYSILQETIGVEEIKSKEANPSEALEIVDKMTNYILLDKEYGLIDDKEEQSIIKDRATIEQALLKAQELEKALKIIIEKCVDMGVLIIDVINEGTGIEGYNSGVSEKYQLTEEEYNTLEEVVINERIIGNN